MPRERYRLTLNDRVRFQGACYRPVEELDDGYVLQLITNGSGLAELKWNLTDDNHREYRRTNMILVDEGFFSRVQRDLSERGDDSDLTDLSEEQLRTVAWKVEWCVRFFQAHGGLGPYQERCHRTLPKMESFIEAERDLLHRWYLQRYGITRPPGREFKGTPQKAYDYPSASTLRDWLAAFEAKDFKEEAFRPRYRNCGNRFQIDPRLLRIVENKVMGFASRGLPDIDDLYDHIQVAVDDFNRGLSPESRASISERAIRRRVRRLSPILVDHGRLGKDRTLRKYMPVGEGMRTINGLEALQRMDRVEMDDWEMDLFTILSEEDVRPHVTAKARRKAAAMAKDRVVIRCTVTAAIDVATKCIVGLNVTPFAPSTSGSKNALKSIFVDKSALAKFADAQGDWSMCGRPKEIATDKGPAFLGDFRMAVQRSGVNRRQPAPDPRARGTIEAFFRNLKSFCRKFTGQSFSNIVKKGDYPAEKMASLFADDILRLLVRFVVDDYHHTPHDGLAGKRPYTAWIEAKNRLNLPPDHFQRRMAFGLTVRNRVLDASGITYMHVDYIHEKMGLLRGFIGSRRLTIIVDPHDMGDIHVRIPDDVRQSFVGEGTYLVFKAASHAGITLAEHLCKNARYRAIERREREAGRPFRLGAIRELMRVSEEARIAAGLPSDELTQEEHLLLLKEIERGGDRAVYRREPLSGEPTNGDDGSDAFGTSVATPANVRRFAAPTGPGTTDHGTTASPSGTSNNMFGEDDE